MRTFANVQELKAAVGETFGPTEWREITQQRVDTFADATDDHQWIHVDVDRAKEGPFGTTIAHGFLTLSLLPSFLPELLTVENVAMMVNFGLNKVRFPKPVPVGSRLRATGELVDVKNSPAGHLATLKVSIELEGERRPVCTAESLLLFVSSE
ncbi:MaoC family dehydratase [Thermoactinospora rubra]|uniref:MaoC family dehydratase n=1 Tax=Thermoactinospora rubra TaxID=1088767 RepID=UPI000A0FFAAF|nr:MaoC family dehydratase [Thermoactinospora rubra]